ncbi:group II intron maturase-specific domain-containing protein [Halioxenophilus aromaticivorans]
MRRIDNPDSRELNPKVTGWVNYFRYVGVRGTLGELAGRLHRYLCK